MAQMAPDMIEDECSKAVHHLHELTAAKRHLWTNESVAVTDSLEQELDAALALFAALLEHLAPGRPLAPELSLGIRDSWRALVDLTYFQLHTRRDDLLQSLFSPKHLAPSAVHLLRVLSHADGLMLTALAELDVARMRTLFQATQAQLTQLRADYLCRTQMQAIVRATAVQFAQGNAKDPQLYCAVRSVRAQHAPRGDPTCATFMVQ
ncbi:hypothetical protein ACKKBF_B04895 [Auxenochlorella protothecoides x Auxenochlorella symbiontica]|uniref:Uncharacterized protein n=2 Tax=Auxenochlorella protothecoides TaxID=3075 RepID=A0A1D2AAB3_AUXPR